MPKLIPITEGTVQPVHVQMDDGSWLYAGKKRAVFSRREALKVSCVPEHGRAWLKGKDHRRVNEKQKD